MEFGVFLSVLTIIAINMKTALAFALPGLLLWSYLERDASSDPGHDKLGAVASESSICSNIGIDTLKSGGNAADTLVATVLCIGVIGMYHR
jgi:hypothetical protein